VADPEGKQEGGSGNKIFPSAESIRSIGGLVAVVAGLIAITGLAVVTMAFVSGHKGMANTLIPLTTAAFGVISAIVGAYLGIKIGTDQTKGMADVASDAHAKLAAVQALVPAERSDELQKALKGPGK
jgi:hypothetical protein